MATSINVIAIGSDFVKEFYDSLIEAEKSSTAFTYNNFYFLAPKIHKHNDWHKREFQFLSDLRNTTIDFALSHFPSDYFLIADDDLLINKDLFRFLEKRPAEARFIGFHCYSTEFRRELITRQDFGSLNFGHTIDYKNTADYDVLPEDIYPDQIYFVETKLMQELKEKFGRWFYSNSDAESEARVFVANAKKLAKVYIANVVNTADFDFKR